MIENIGVKYKNYEFRAVDRNLLRKDKLETIELVKWSGETCYTIFYWKKSGREFDLVFIGQRPFKEIGKEDVPKLWNMASSIQEYLDNLTE